MEDKIKAITVDMGSLPIRKWHKRSLELILTNTGKGNYSAPAFLLNFSFAYWKPEMENGYLVDVYCNKDPKYLYYNGIGDLYGKLTRPDKKYKYMVIKLNLNHYEFYSMGKGGDIHKTIIDLRYVPSKDLTEFNVVYDMDTLVKLDTNGDYSLKHLKSSPKGLAEKEGNLLSEKDLTLYLNNDIPVKICAEPSKEKI